MALDKKVIAIFKVMERFLYQKEIANDDAYLLSELDCSYRTLERYLKDIAMLEKVKEVLNEDATKGYFLNLKESRVFKFPGIL